mmetsp:Transcript_16374/g.31574  ORF Transcript_16374/g.31574 Transcript_16374/m.31574 type:complete len:260 (+) Transcript_16374:247-1026(+)
MPGSCTRDAAALAAETSKKISDGLATLSSDIVALEACEGWGNDLIATNLATRIRERQADLRREMEELEGLGYEQSREEDQEDVMTSLGKHHSEYQRIKGCLRIANATLKAKSLKAAEDERAELLRGGDDTAARQRRIQTEAEQNAAAEEVTAGLRRTRQLMAQELEHSGKAVAALGESNLTLRKVETEFLSQQPLLRVSKRLLSYLKRQEVIDRILVIVCFVLFLMVVLHIVLKRVPLLNTLHPYNWWKVYPNATKQEL